MSDLVGRRAGAVACVLALLLTACRGPSVLHIGLDGATFDVIVPLVEHGYMPTVAALMERGAWGDLDCVPALPSFACFCPPVWTSIATGQPQAEHKILSLLSLSTQREVPAIWSVLEQTGRASLLISFRATWPSQSLLNVVVSEGQLDRTVQEVFEAWPSPSPLPGFEDPSPLFPILKLTPIEGERPPSHRPMARDRLAVDLLVAIHRRLGRNPDLTMILLHSIDKTGHITWGGIQRESGGPFNEPKILRLAASAVENGPTFAGPPFGWGTAISQYIEADDMIARMLETSRYDYVVITSDHGMDRNPSPGLPGHHTRFQPAAWDGIFIAAGRGIRPGTRFERASVLDVAPTLAYLLRLPVSDELPGEVLDIFSERWRRQHPVRRVPSWNDLEPHPSRRLIREHRVSG
jgi:hypothetical protein